mgnify:CR=1 FL=1
MNTGSGLQAAAPGATTACLPLRLSPNKIALNGRTAVMLLLLGFSGNAQAAEMKAGDWISKDNYEQVKNNTFEGHTIEEIAKMLDRQKRLEKELEQLKAKLASSQGSDLAGQAIEVDGLKVLAARLDGADPKSLRDTVDQLKNKLGSGAIVLATVSGDKVSLVAGVTKDATGRIKAGDLVNLVATQVGGKGGGRPDMAQAGGNDPSKLDDALRGVTDWVKQQISA